ncbi:MAG: dephospho-CoA kinase [Eubacterium sp.]|nr:dephospho-CoA kinase [Eubacterium sp.]
MKIIGITGGVGCGKSEVMRFLETNYKGVAVRSDELAADMMKRGGICFEPVLAIFGEGVLGPDGEFDRKKIAARVFQREEELKKLNNATHPLIRETLLHMMKEAETDGEKWFFLESALLINEKYNEICDEVWYVYADEQVRRERLKESRGYSEEKITAVMNNQLSEEEFRAVSTFVVDNSGDFDETARCIEQHMKEIL